VASCFSALSGSVTPWKAKAEELDSKDEDGCTDGDVDSIEIIDLDDLCL